MNARVNINVMVAVVLTEYGAKVYNSYMEQFATKFHPFYCCRGRASIEVSFMGADECLWEVFDAGGDGYSVQGQ